MSFCGNVYTFSFFSRVDCTLHVFPYGFFFPPEAGLIKLTAFCMAARKAKDQNRCCKVKWQNSQQAAVMTSTRTGPLLARAA